MLLPRTSAQLIALLAVVAAIALPGAAEAAVIPSVSSDTLTLTGDGAPDRIVLRVIAPGTLQVDTGVSTFNFKHVDTKPGLDSVTLTGTTNQLIGFTFS